MPSTRLWVPIACFALASLFSAIVVCSLAPSPNMREMWWIPDWLGTWADRNGNFRNFPVFAALAALLFFIFSFLPSAFHSGLKLKFQPFSFRTALRAAVCTSALGASLEALQLLLPNRHADPMDLLWMTLGAFVGAFSAGSVSTLWSSRSGVLRLNTVD